MRELCGSSVRLQEGEFLRRERSNREYLMKLPAKYLLRNYELEAGRYSGRGHDASAFDGWEDPTCQLRGHFLGHWLSAAALRYQETGDRELLAKTEYILEELEACQKDNGGEWVCPIPEKYLYWIGQGRGVWAPQYTIHKLFMGLVDAYRYMKIDRALAIADRLADWFLRWSGEYSEEQFDDILDVETGGMLEIWADLLEITGSGKYRTLLERYYRGRLFDPLLEGKDVLTNMHANTTIPEALGCARAYEVTGEEKWLRIVECYWKCAVTDRGSFATGGQTQGEIWTPKQKLKARLGDKNQEHCTVYNMVRLAEFLFRQTKDPSYMHYIEYNVENGLAAQTYWQGISYKGSPNSGLLTYFLPMKAGSRKDWAGETDSFFCCHGTMVQANAAWNRRIYYIEGDSLYITMYTASEASFELGGREIKLSLRQGHMNGSLMLSSENNALQTVNEIAGAHANKPDYRKYIVTIRTESNAVFDRVDYYNKLERVNDMDSADAPDGVGAPDKIDSAGSSDGSGCSNRCGNHDDSGRSESAAEFTVNLRIPDWINGPATVIVNDEAPLKISDTQHFATLRRVWNDGDQIAILLPIGVKFVPLPDDPTTGAFRYGPDVLAGITGQERILYLDGDRPEDELSVDTEREWGSFLTCYRTENQDPGISFRMLKDIGYEPYQIYFKVKRRQGNMAD